MVIIPKNFLLASVNFFLATVSIGQLTRIAHWRMSVMGDSPKETVKYMFDMKD